MAPSAPVRPVEEAPELAALVETDHWVHLVVRIENDWETAREAAVAEVESKTEAALRYARSAAFRARFGSRIAVIRVQSPRPAPSIVAPLLTEKGIELEDLSAQVDAGERCAFCGRSPLSVEQARMTDDGWACPSCFQAWTIRQQPQLARPPRRWPRVPSKLVIPLVLLLVVLFLVGAMYELGRLNGMNSIIRQHMPQ